MQALFHGPLYRTVKQNALGFIGAADHITTFQMVYDTTLTTQCFLCSSTLQLCSYSFYTSVCCSWLQPWHQVVNIFLSSEKVDKALDEILSGSDIAPLMTVMGWMICQLVSLLQWKEQTMKTECTRRKCC
jgi:hypothetical protein